MTTAADRVDEAVAEIARQVSGQLLEQGASAVFLTGSHARGTATERSDIDLFVIGAGPKERLRFVDGRLVGAYWWTAQEARQRMYLPEKALISVLGWRQAVLLDDPSGIGAEIQREAHEWSWEKIGAEADAWVTEQLVGWVEYVQKLVTALEQERKLDVCALRNETALKLSHVMGVHKRVMAASENGLWETIGEAGGPEWREAQERAFTVNGEDVPASAGAALTLFALLAKAADALLDERQREVVGYALRISERWRS